METHYAIVEMEYGIEARYYREYYTTLDDARKDLARLVSIGYPDDEYRIKKITTEFVD